METKELIFNGKKFFEGEYPCYIGKTIRHITSYRIPTSWFDNDSGTMRENPAPNISSAFNNKMVKGQMVLVKSIYLKVPNGGDWLKVSDILQNGGSIE